MKETTGSLEDIDQLLEHLTHAKEVLFRPSIKALKLPPQEELLTWIRQLEQQRFHSGQRFTIMVLGEFNAGKSTLLNAILELPQELRLPISYDPTTARPIRLSYKTGDQEAYWLMRDGSKVSQPWQEALLAADQTAERTAMMAEVQEVHLLLEHPFLYQADILDMPGTGTAEFEEHTYLTREYLNNVEMIIWVIGAHEPSQVGKRDFIEARRAGVPITVVFNAWGVLDEEEDREVAIDQDEFEAGVRKHFREAFQDEGAVFRIYARKCLEAKDAEIELPPAFGLAAFHEYLAQQYLNEFADHRYDARLLIRAKIARIVQEALPVLEEAQRRWEDVQQDDAENKDIVAVEKRARRLDMRIRGELQPLADDCSRAIIGYLSHKTEQFIQDNISVTNIHFLRGSVDKKYLEKYLGTKLRQEYLHLDQPGNWLEEQIEEFLQRCWIIVEADWSSFLDELAVSLSGRGQNVGERIQMPLDEIRRAVQATIKSTLSQLVAGLATLGLILVSSIVTFVGLAVLVIALPILTSRFDNAKANAIKSARQEIAIQRVGLTNDLIKLAMNNLHEPLRQNFDRQIALRRHSFSEKEALLKQGVEELDRLHQVFAAVKERPA